MTLTIHALDIISFESSGPTFQGGKMKKISAVILIGIVWACFMVLTGCEVDESGSLEGRMTMNGEPVQGISIHTFDVNLNYSKYTETDAQGRYAFNVNEYTSYNVIPELTEEMEENYAILPSSHFISVSESNPDISGLDFEIVSKYSDTIGQITVDGEPLIGAFVVLTDYSPAGSQKMTVSTDTNGEFLIEGFKPGKYNIKPILKGYSFTPEVITIDFPEDHLKYLDFTAIAINDPEPCWGAYYDTSEHHDSLEDLSGYTSVTRELIIRNSSLVNLAGLESLREIGKSLIIEKNAQLSDFEGLGNLTTVGKIIVSENPALTRLSGLDSLTSSTAVSICDNDNLTDLNGFDNFTAIQSLGIESNDSLASLAGLDNLTYIDNLSVVENHGLSRLDGFAGSPSARLVSIIRNNSLTDLSGLEHIEGILQLDISGNQAITSLESLGNVYATTLILTGNNSITTLDGLFGDRTVVEGSLKLVENESLTSLEGLNQLTHLGGVTIQYQHDISSLAPLSNLTSLGRVYLNGNDALTSFAGLEKLTTATDFIIANSQFKDFKGLDHLTQLSYLGLASNASLQSLDGLENLNTVDRNVEIANNDALTSLEGLYNVTYIGGDLYICLIDYTSVGDPSEDHDNQSLTRTDVNRLVDQIGEDNIDGLVLTTYYPIY